MQILIVEDDVNSQIILKGLISSYGECTIVEDGSEAVKAYEDSLLNNKPYDLICMDIMMPNLNGIEALEKIRKIERRKRVREQDMVKVIMTTALDDSEMVFNSLYNLGAASYIVKPFTKLKVAKEMQKLGIIE